MTHFLIDRSIESVFYTVQSVWRRVETETLQQIDYVKRSNRSYGLNMSRLFSFDKRTNGDTGSSLCVADTVEEELFAFIVAGAGSTI